MSTDRRVRRGEAGVTLVEVLVAMSIFSIVLLVFVDAIRVMTTSLSRVSAVTTSVTESRSAADVLSRQLSYASAANLPSYNSTDRVWFFEFESDAVRAGTDNRCTQWRYLASTGLLQYRSFSVVSLASTGWSTVSTSLANDPVTQPPFTLLTSDSGFAVMRLAVDLRLRSAGGVVVPSSAQYALRNSLDAPVPTTSTVCLQLGRPTT